MASRARVAFYGAGQLATNASSILRSRGSFAVLGPFGRAERDTALRCGADVVVIATTSFLTAVAEDIRLAVESGSNVITTAEEAAYPWANDAEVANQVDALARSRGVTVLGAGLNPGFAFDALVLTACGVVEEVESFQVERVVDLSGFSANVLRRLGIAHSAQSLQQGLSDGSVTGHIGFRQSMQVVAGRLGVEIERIDGEFEPIFAERDLANSSLTVRPRESAGFRQHYRATASGRVWFDALFTGHVAPVEIGESPRDSITIRTRRGEMRLDIVPGINPQSGSASVIANSVLRVMAAPPGWTTVAELPPAVPV